MKPGREIARFEQRVAAHSTTLCRAYQALLLECGSTLYRWYSPTSKVTNAWRRVRGWALKFPNLEAARADYLKHGYMELPVTGRAQPSRP
jgi:hypothetical protein